MARRTPPRQRTRFIVQLALPIALLAVVGLVAFIVLKPSPPVAAPTTPACPQVPDVVVGEISVPAGPIAGYCQPELINAAQIIRAADRWTTSDKAKAIGVMTAIGESRLRILNYGDTAGPDSRGLFQQRSNYGPLSRRMNAYSSAYDFYQRMLGIVGWEKLSPTQVAHRVQGNANPDYYTPYFPTAEEIVTELLGDRVPPPLTASPTPPPPALRP